MADGPASASLGVTTGGPMRSEPGEEPCLSREPAAEKRGAHTAAIAPNGVF